MIQSGVTSSVSTLTRTQTVAFGVSLAVLFLLTALFRFQALSTGFTNDHYLHLAAAQQILLGEWPTRDFLDPGMPLMFLTSAVAQVLLGRTLFAEAILVASGFALAAVLTAAAVRELTGSRLLGLIAAALEVSIVPRAYAYPKVLAYAAGVFLLQRYVSRPTRGRLLALAVAVVVAFLFRHDHGVYLGIGGTLAAALAPMPGGARGGIRRAALFAGMTALLLLPYLAYVQVHGGLPLYVQQGLEFREVELERQPHVWPSVYEQPDETVLFYAYWLIPITAAAVLLASRTRPGVETAVARVAPVAVVAVLVNSTVLRDALQVRLADAIAPAVIVGAWVMARAWGARRRVLWAPVSVAALWLTAQAVIGVGHTGDQIRRGSLHENWRRWPGFVAETASRLRSPEPPRRIMPSRIAEALLPFYPYVHRCVAPKNRVLLVGDSTVEALFFMKRGFAGGLPVLVERYYDSDAHQQATVAKLRQQAVPFVLLTRRAHAGEFDAAFPVVAAYVRERYAPLVTFGGEENGVQVMIHRAAPVFGTDPATGWPCLRPPQAQSRAG